MTISDCFYSHTRQSIETHCQTLGVPTSHSKELFRAAYKNLLTDPWSKPGLPKVLTSAFASVFHTGGCVFDQGIKSGYDHSIKFRSHLHDMTVVETVLMPESRRLTLCLSTQVGCAQGCIFCHTGRMGLKRHLSAGEIVGQVVAAQKWLRTHPEWMKTVNLPLATNISNIVFMGMGEPLDNVDAVIDSLKILTDPYGLALGLRHISVSTAGHLDGIKALLSAIKGVRLALSVHSPDEAQRSKIMPINRVWPLRDVIDYLTKAMPANGGTVMFQYTLIAGVNDSLGEAEDLASMALKINAKINLIPLNPVAISRLQTPDAARIQKFRDIIHKRGIRVMVRYSKGQDIAAACGQLVVEKGLDNRVGH